ncbi:acetyl-CoA carboxylase biotin carboxyl carrier protein [Victivallis sp. Marseille-Q1083]|uniref:acetyl-CoA carboxylase biotin carboxyl carrier protein n=1 Tax=Victivallis sp. Marseille-Q1083 TaxID=2717288 RepID=UPI001C378B92|nr:acetyl-CoA carboxylase biotin carboxyl carrier protein [Victivallis sp. Marseille-Q1083]
MKIEEIKTIVKLMSENDLTEFKIEAEEYNLCIKRGGTQVAISAPAPAVPLVSATLPAPAAVPVPVTVPTAEQNNAPLNTIDAPLVGTFYRAGSPDAKPFIQIGDKVTAETTVAIIEAMKVMNEIKAEKAGVIKDVLVENGQAVEYGQPLFVIE